MADWTLLAVGSAVCAGLTAILAKIGVENVPSNVATLIRTAVVLLFVVVLISLRRQWPHASHLSARSLLFLVLSGVTTALSWLCYYQALQRGPASLVASLDKLSVAIAVVLAVVVLGERLTRWQWLGAALTTAGALLLALT